MGNVQRAVIVGLGLLFPTVSQAGFEVLELPPNGEDFYHTQATAISGDGQVVVGQGTYVYVLSESFLSIDTAVRWNNGTAALLYPIMPGHVRTLAGGVSGDGSIVTGAAYREAPFPSGGFVWHGGAFTSLEDLVGGANFSSGSDVSADGSVIVGAGIDGVNDRAVRWDDGVPTNLGTGLGWSYAEGVSADGTIVVGFQQNAGAMRWKNGVDTVLTPPQGDFGTRAFGVSADGSTIVGQSLQSHGDEAVRWYFGVPALLGTLPGHVRSVANDASRHGAIVVGYSADANGTRSAVVWDQQNGMRALRDILLAMGDPVTNWSLREAHAISDEGDVIVGWGVDPSGHERGFIARVSSSDPVPEPGMGAALVSGVLALVALRARRRGDARVA